MPESCINCGSTPVDGLPDPCDCDHDYSEGVCSICKWECEHDGEKDHDVCCSCGEVIK